MKVLNLRCDNEHAFEGWFASGEEFERQLASTLVQCPVCGSHQIDKLLSAPRINRGAAAPVSSERDTKQPMAMANDDAMAAMLQLARKMVAASEDVGERFPEEARRIHYDEAPKRSIRGVASKAEAAELADEGIDVLPLPFGDLLKPPQ